MKSERFHFKATAENVEEMWRETIRERDELKAQLTRTQRAFEVARSAMHDLSQCYCSSSLEGLYLKWLIEIDNILEDTGDE